MYIARFVVAVCFAMVSAGALAAPTTPDRIPPIRYSERTLTNGMKVIVSQDLSTPNVTIQMWYGVGSKDDPQGRSGFAHLFEHMMFKATHDLPAESLDRFTEDVGGENNASTWDDFTNYYEIVPANHLERLIWVEAQRLGSLVVDEANFKSERDVVKEELRQRVLADPYGRLFALYLPQATYKIHPYKRPGIGSIEELDAATLDDVQAFHNAYYRPDNAALVVVGNLDEKQVQAWIDKYLAPLKNPTLPFKRVTAVEPPRTGPGVYDGYGPNVPLPAVAITWLSVEAADPDAPALRVLDAILSSGKSSRLYDSLVYDQQISAQIFSNVDLPQQPGMVMVGSIMASGHSVAEGEAALLAQVKRLRDAPPSPAELSEAKSELISAKLRERETIDGRAFALGYALRTEGDAGQANRSLSSLQAVTALDIQRVVRKYLSDDRRMTIRYQAGDPKAEMAATAKPPTQQIASVPYRGPVSVLAPEGLRQAPPPIGAPVAARLPRPVEKILANGLRVIVAKSSDLPLVTADLTIGSGAWADPPGLAGTAKLAADMLTEGTRSQSARTIARTIESLGAVLTSSGSQDSASVTVNVMPGKLAKAMAVMADVARNPAFAKAELERQRSQALDGLSVSLQEPGSLTGFATAPVLFEGTPFGHVTGGTPTSLPKITPDDLRRVHQTYFRPDNATLVLTGDISAEAGLALAQTAFGTWTRPTTPLSRQPGIQPSVGRRAIVIDLPGTGQASVTLAKVGISRSNPDYYPGLVANAVLGGGYSARLNSEIRIKRGLSYGAGSRLTAEATTGQFRASAQTKNESTAQVLDLIRAQMRDLMTIPATADEFRARKSSLIGSYGRNLATTDGLAEILGNLALYHVPLSELAAYSDKVESVTTDQVQAFFKTYLNPDTMSVIVAGDAKAFVDDLKTRTTDLEVIPAGALDLDAPSLRKTPKS
ncbi:MAG: peptidase M16 [Phenylobacterium zucineum]|nr:MAG: peptidase M16 [Phenylobacterium zucineum]